MGELSSVVVVTGGAGGIGAALARRWAAAGHPVVVTDRDLAGAERVAREVGGLARRLDVTDPQALESTVAAVEREVGPIGLFCSNAGVAFGDGRADTAFSQPPGCWEMTWKVNVMAHVWAARAVVPRMLERGGGQFLVTASAAGLLHHIGDAAYSTTKHAAIGYAEALAITHGDEGLQVAALCPQAVETGFLDHVVDAGPLVAAASADGILEPAEVAEAAWAGLEAGHFLILPHPQVREYFLHKASDYDRWLGGMRKIRRKLRGGSREARGPDR